MIRVLAVIAIAGAGFLIGGQFGGSIGSFLTGEHPADAFALGAVVVAVLSFVFLLLVLHLIGQDAAGSTSAFGRRIIGAVVGLPYLAGGAALAALVYAALAFGVFYAVEATRAWSLEPFGSGLWAGWTAFAAWTGGLPYAVKWIGALCWLGLIAVTGLKWQRAWKGWTGALAEWLAMQFVGSGFGRGGSAAFAGILAEWGMRYRPGAYLLGSSMYDRGWWVGREDDRGLITIAATRSGKGRSSIIPNLLLWPESALVIDPKGTNAAVTARRRGRGGGRVTHCLGQDVHVLDPFQVVKGVKSARFNPLSAIDVEADTVREDIFAIADAMVTASPGKDPHWEEIAKLILAGLIAHELVTAPQGKVCTLEDVRAHLRRGARYLDRLFGAMAGNFDAGGIAAAAAAVFASAGPNERGSFFTTLMRNTAWLDSIPMKRVLGGRSDFSIGDLKWKKMSVYVVLPPELLDAHARFLRLFVSMAMHAASSGGKGRYRTLFVLDEFFALGNLSVMERAAAALGSYGVRPWPIVQNVTQLSSLYPGNWETFFSAASAVQAFGVNDRATQEYLVNRLGRRVSGPDARRMVSNLREADELSRDVARERNRSLVLRIGDTALMVKRLDYDRVFPKSWYSPDPDFEAPEAALDAAPPGSKMDELIKAGGLSPERSGAAMQGSGAAQAGGGAAVEESVEAPPLPADVEEARLDDAEAEADDFASGLVEAWRRERGDRIKEAEAEEKGVKTAPPSQRKAKPKQAAERKGKKRGTANRESEAIAKLEAMIGLENVKQEVQGVLAQISTNRKREAAGLPPRPLSRHMIFSGNPGTGKTTVARIIGEIYRETGLLRSGHLVEAKKGDLIAEHVGGTAQKTRLKCTEALDGVLFIDEAYGLAEKKTSYGPEAIEELMTFMEDNRDRIVVIAAGYKDEMAKFVKSNPGLESRFSKVVAFEDYTADEMEQMFLGLCEEDGFRLGDGAAGEKVRALMLAIYARKGETFGNGRTVRNAYEKSIDNYNRRIARTTDPTTEQLITLEAGDIPDDAGELA